MRLFAFRVENFEHLQSSGCGGAKSNDTARLVSLYSIASDSYLADAHTIEGVDHHSCYMWDHQIWSFLEQLRRSYLKVSRN